MDGPPPLPPLARLFFASGVVLFAVTGLYYGSKVLIPFAVAVLAWFLINAVARGFQKIPLVGRRLPRPAALLMALALICAAGFLTADLVVRNVTAMSQRPIDFQASLNPVVDMIAGYTDLSDKKILNEILDRIGLERLFRRIVSAVSAFTGQLGVVLVYVLFLMVDQQFFEAKLAALVPDEARRRHIRGIIDRTAQNVQRYLWVMTFVSGLTAGLSYAVMSWVGLEHASFWALLIFILNFIPTIGSVIGSLLPAVFALIQFKAFEPALVLLAGIGVIQFLIGNLLQPRLAGRTLNLSQLVVVLSLFVWGAIWGVTGMFLAVPITAVMMIAFSSFEATRPIAILLSEKGQIHAPPED